MADLAQGVAEARMRVSKPDAHWVADRAFHGGMTLLFVVLIFVGFAPSYYLRDVVAASQPLLELTPLIHVHAVLFSLWVVLFVVQVALIAVRKPLWHRRLGYWGFGLGVVLLVVGTLTGLQGVERASGPPGIPPLQWLAVPLTDILFLTLLLTGAYVTRRHAQWHKRLMLMTMIGLLTPAVFRIQLPAFLQIPIFLASDFLVLVLLVWDLRRDGKVHLATMLGIAAIIAWRLLPGLVWETSVWLDFASWASRFA